MKRKWKWGFSEIREYLAYYIDCNCFVDLSRYIKNVSSEIDLTRIPAVFNSINRNKSKWAGITFIGEKGFEYRNSDNVLCYRSSMFIYPEDLTLELRELEDMTEQELITWFVIHAQLGLTYSHASLLNMDFLDEDNVTDYWVLYSNELDTKSQSPHQLTIGWEGWIREAYDFRWFITHRFDVFGLIKKGKAYRKELSVMQKFENLVRLWNNEIRLLHLDSETGIYSSEMAIYYYREIIKLAKKEPEILLYIFAIFKKGPENWFKVLVELTGENPARNENVNDIVKVQNAWLQWAKERKLIL